MKKADIKHGTVIHQDYKTESRANTEPWKDYLGIRCLGGISILCSQVTPAGKRCNV